MEVKKLLQKVGFSKVILNNRLLPEDKPGTTWFLLASGASVWYHSSLGIGRGLTVKG